MKQIFCLISVLFLCLTACKPSNQWPNHDISTLKLLQIVHRHGDRAPLLFSPNDPYKNESYWPEGVGELTTKGKYRMYKRGQFIREAYNSYLGDNHSPREVYARSSMDDRCIESVSCLLSGAYPPQQKVWKWSNGTDAELGNIWQPFPIQTFMPKTDDFVCEQDKFCLAVYNEMAKSFKKPAVVKYLEESKEFYSNLSKISGSGIRDLISGGTFWDTLNIETENNYYWTHVWTKEEQKKIVERMALAHEMEFQYSWDSPVIKRLRGGGLVKELNKNFQSVVDNHNKKKVYVYSTHDSVVAALMHALNVYNGRSPPYGATLLFELHEKRNGSERNTNDYFLRVFYHNETLINGGIPHSIPLTDCQNQVDCPLKQYFDSTQHLLYDDFQKECNQKH